MDNHLQDLEWNELVTPPDLEEALLSVVAVDNEGAMHAIGTAFIFKSENQAAYALSAGHVFSEVKKLRSRAVSASHRSTLPEFLPPAPPADLSLEHLTMVARKGVSQAIFYTVNGLAFDSAADIGLAKLSPQPGDEKIFGPKEWLLDAEMPSIDEIVYIASYVDLAARTLIESQSHELRRRPIIRVGRVSAVFPNGARLCRGPCFETSIPIFSGMSGGPVYRLIGDKVGVIGVVCSDPDLDGPQKNDRTIAGRSLIALIPTTRVSGTIDSIQEIELNFFVTATAGKFN